LFVNKEMLMKMMQTSFIYSKLKSELKLNDK
jgi:hypothetical protein